MPELHEVVDRIHYDNHRDYTRKQGNVNYLDATPLTRPFSMPAGQRVILIIIIAIAVIIGIVLVNSFVISRWQAAEEAERSISENLARPASIESLPTMTSLINMDNDGIKSAFANAGYTIYDDTGRDESYDLALYRLPQDVTLDEVASYYAKGLSSLSAQEATKLFEGGWFFAADRVNGTSMVVRYADFSTGDPQIAVQNAILKQGFDTTTISDTGEDESGNTYSAGTFTADDGATCTWKVSALPLDNVYSISGLPENACYVGVRVTRA